MSEKILIEYRRFADKYRNFNPVIAPDGNIYGFRSDSGIIKIDT